MSKPAAKTTALSTETFTTPGEGMRDLLKDIRSSEVLTGSPQGVQLMQRIEDAFAGIIERSSLGTSQITNANAMRAYMDFGNFVSKGSATLPDHLKNNPADCTAIAMRADRWGLDFYGVAEKTHIIQGKLGYESQLVGAILTNMRAITGKPHDEYFGPWEKILGKFKELESKTKKDPHGHPAKYKVPAWKIEDEEGLGIRFWATLTGETEPREIEVFMSQALVRNSTLWATNPKQQIFYLAQKLWARKYAPEALLGVHTVEDLLDMQATKNMGDADVVQPKGLDDDILGAWAAAAAKGTDSARKYWSGLTPEQRRIATEDQKKEMWSAAVEADTKRTYDTPAAAATGAATATPDVPEKAAAAEPAADAPKTMTEAADQSTGEVDDEFVRGMDAVDAAKGDAK